MKKRFSEEQITGSCVMRMPGCRSRSCVASTASVKAECQAPEGAGDGEQSAEEAAGRADAQERGDQGRCAKRTVSAPARRALVRQRSTGD